MHLADPNCALTHGRRYAHAYRQSSDRLTRPLLREGDGFREIGWEEAIRWAAERLESIRLTIFRQTLFADFELRFHEHAEAGNPLTAEYLNSLYADMIREYYGPGFELGPDDECEWMFIPHFYYNFYVYQYSTSFTASTAMSQAILADEEGAVERTIEFLSAGASDYPVAVLKQAGVDMMTSDPFDRTMTVMNDVMDQIEEILDRQE